MGISAICSIPLAIDDFTHVDLGAVPAVIWLTLLLLGAIGTGGLHLMRSDILARMEAGKFSMMFLLSPVLSALMGGMFLGEHIGWSLWIGLIFIVIGMVIPVIFAADKKAHT